MSGAGWGFYIASGGKVASFTYKTEQAALSLRQFPGVAEQMTSAEGPETPQTVRKVCGTVTGSWSREM